MAPHYRGYLRVTHPDIVYAFYLHLDFYMVYYIRDVTLIIIRSIASEVLLEVRPTIFMS